MNEKIYVIVYSTNEYHVNNDYYFTDLENLHHHLSNGKFIKQIEIPESDESNNKNQVTKYIGKYKANYIKILNTDIQNLLESNKELLTLNQKVMKDCVEYSHIELFDICINEGISVSEDIFNRISYFNDTYMFKKCIVAGCIPTLNNLNDANMNNNIEIFKICLNYVYPTQSTMDAAIFNRNIDIMKLCWQYGLISDNYKNLPINNVETLKLYMEHGYLLKTETMKEAVIHNNQDVFSYCIGYGLKPDMDLVVSYGGVDILDSCLKYGFLLTNSQIRTLIYNNSIAKLKVIFDKYPDYHKEVIKQIKSRGKKDSLELLYKYYPKKSVCCLLI